MQPEQIQERPFGGAWNGPDWPGDDGLTDSQRSKVKKGRTVYVVACRAEPHGDLVAFADALAKAMGVSIAHDPDPSHRSMFFTYTVVAKSLPQALGATEFAIRRMLRKTGFTLHRLSYDVKEGWADA